MTDGGRGADGDDDADGGERPTPPEVFELLGDRTRLDILRALVAHQRAGDFGEGLAFAELRKAVGVADAGTLHEHGVDVRDAGAFRAEFVGDPDAERVVSGSRSRPRSASGSTARR